MLTVDNLTAQVNGKTIINGISLAVRPGEIHIMMGPNGSGKTSFARTVVGFPEYDITKGSIKLDSILLNNKSIDERARLGLFMSFQYPISVPGVSYRNFLRSALNSITSNSNYLSIREFSTMVEGYAKQLDIPLTLLDRDLNHDLSGGEKKKMEILQLMVLKPKYAILDEIDSGLDIDANRTLYSFINSIIKNHKMGIIVITHYEKILKYLTPDFVYILKDGNIIEHGGKELVERISNHGFTKKN